MLTQEELEYLFTTNRNKFDDYMEIYRQVENAKAKNPNLDAYDRELFEQDYDEKTKAYIERYPSYLQTDTVKQTLTELNRLQKIVKTPNQKRHLAILRNCFFRGVCATLDYYSKGKVNPEIETDEIYHYEDYLNSTVDYRGYLVMFCVRAKIDTHLVRTLRDYKIAKEVDIKSSYEAQKKNLKTM